MGKQERDIYDGLKRLAQADALVRGGDITAVDEGAATCSVKLANELVITDVHLKALKEANKGILIVPKVGSYVQIINLGEPDWYVIAWEEIDKVLLKIGDQTSMQLKDGELKGVISNSKLTMNASGFKIERSGETLKKLLDDLLQAILQLTVTTSTGPSGTPINIAAFQNVKTRIPNLLT